MKKKTILRFKSSVVADVPIEFVPAEEATDWKGHLARRIKSLKKFLSKKKMLFSEKLHLVTKEVREHVSTEQPAVVVDEAQDSPSKCSEDLQLFGSGSKDSESGSDDRDENSPFTEGHDNSVSVLEVPEISISVEPTEEGSDESVDQSAGQDNSENMRGHSIVSIVQTPELTVQQLEGNVMPSDLVAKSEKVTEARGASMHIAEITDLERQKNDFAEQGTSSSSGTGSDKAVVYEDNGGSSVDNSEKDTRSGSALPEENLYITDSDTDIDLYITDSDTDIEFSGSSCDFIQVDRSFIERLITETPPKLLKTVGRYLCLAGYYIAYMAEVFAELLEREWKTNIIMILIFWKRLSGRFGRL